MVTRKVSCTGAAASPAITVDREKRNLRITSCPFPQEQTEKWNLCPGWVVLKVSVDGGRHLETLHEVWVNANEEMKTRWFKAKNDNGFQFLACNGCWKMSCHSTGTNVLEHMSLQERTHPAWGKEPRQESETAVAWSRLASETNWSWRFKQGHKFRGSQLPLTRTPVFREYCSVNHRGKNRVPWRYSSILVAT